jgi:hypothetical protein
MCLIEKTVRRCTGYRVPNPIWENGRRSRSSGSKAQVERYAMKYVRLWRVAKLVGF